MKYQSWRRLYLSYGTGKTYREDAGLRRPGHGGAPPAYSASPRLAAGPSAPSPFNGTPGSEASDRPTGEDSGSAPFKDSSAMNIAINTPALVILVIAALPG